jgi:SsrA-binding protein
MKTIAVNRRASHDYTFIETYEAGLVLSGQEVKSVKNGGVSLRGSFITFSGNEAFLTNAHINPYKQANVPDSYDPTQPRKILLKRNEIDKILGKKQSRGLTIIPLKIYVKKRGLIKISIALAQGKKLYDKRQSIKVKEYKRRIQRNLRNT